MGFLPVEACDITTKVSAALVTHSLSFLLRCRDTNTLPSCVTVKHHLCTKAAKKILHRASQALLKERIRNTRHELHRCSVELSHIHLKVSSTLKAEDWNTVDRITFESSINSESNTRETQKKKFEKISHRQHGDNSTSDQVQPVVNLTEIALDDATTKILSKGLDFAIAPADVPKETIITEVESFLKAKLRKSEKTSHASCVTQNHQGRIYPPQKNGPWRIFDETRTFFSYQLTKAMQRLL